MGSQMLESLATGHDMQRQHGCAEDVPGSAGEFDLVIIRTAMPKNDRSAAGAAGPCAATSVPIIPLHGIQRTGQCEAARRWRQEFVMKPMLVEDIAKRWSAGP